MKNSKGDRQLSVCCTIRNRTKVDTKYGTLNLFSDCVASLKAACENALIEWELVLTDWKSTDTDYKWLPENHQLILINKKGFSRGYGLNVAAENAKYSNLLFIDTDMLVTSSFIKRCLGHCQKKRAYFPICWSVAEPDRKKSKSFLGTTLPNKKWNGRAGRTGWRITGRGMCSMQKSIWNDVGKWPEYWKWGREDGDYCTKFRRKKIKVIRKNENGLVHCWHPTMRT